MTKIKRVLVLARIVSRELTISIILFFFGIALHTGLVRLADACQQIWLHTGSERKADGLCRFGSLYEKHDYLDRAISCFKSALEIEPNSAMSHFYLGIVFEKKGDTSDAVHHYGQALALGSDFGVEFQSQLEEKIVELNGGRGHHH